MCQTNPSRFRWPKTGQGEESSSNRVASSAQRDGGLALPWASAPRYAKFHAILRKVEEVRGGYMLPVGL